MQSRARGGDDLRTNYTKEISGAEDEAGDELREAVEDALLAQTTTAYRLATGWRYRPQTTTAEDSCPQRKGFRPWKPSPLHQLRGCEYVDMGEVQSHVLKAVGLELSEEELNPIVDELIDELNEQLDERESAKRAARSKEIMGPQPHELPPECCYDEERERMLGDRMCEAHARWLLYSERLDQATKVGEHLEGQRRLFDGTTRITADNAESFQDNLDFESIPSLKEYRNKAKRTPDSLPARFYRMVTGEEWDGATRSYDLACKRFRRLLPENRRDEQEREQRRQRHKGKRTQVKGIAKAKAARPSSTLDAPRATSGVAIAPEQPTSGGTGISPVKKLDSASVTNKPRATGSATSSASATLATAAPKPQRDDERFGGPLPARAEGRDALHATDLPPV